jgi:two-component system, NarL family, invasion response regulator UvrY
VTITVAVADDHAVVREGVIRILSDEGDISVVGSAATGDELVGLVLHGLRPGAALVDLAMPSGGLDLVARLHELRPELRILVYSMHPEREYAVRCLSAGASGYVSKGCSPHTLVEAIRTVADGRRYISEAVADVLASYVLDGPVDRPHERLSNREYEVFRRLAGGESSGEIAEALGLSVKSVSTYRARVLEKLHVARNADLTRYALEHALLD